MKVAIVGAGVSGVSLAYLLSKKKRDGADLDITVFEADGESGGCIRTKIENGYLVESGPNGILNSREHVTGLVKDGGFQNLVEFSSEYTKKRFLQQGNKIYPAPSGLISAINTPLLSFRGKLRILAEPFINNPCLDGDESVADFATRRVGKEAADKLIAALVGGIFAGDTEKLSICSAFPKLYHLEKEFGSIVRGMFKGAKGKPEKKRAKDRYKLISTSGGMKGFVTMLESAATGAKFLYNTQVTAITKESGKYRLSTAQTTDLFDAVAVCTNAKSQAKLVADVDKELVPLLEEIVFAPLFVCGFGFDRKSIAHPLDGFGYLVSVADVEPLLGVLFSSTLFSGRAPEGKVLLTCISVGDKARQYFAKNDDELAGILLSHIRATLDITGEPETVLTFRTEYAIPQYYIGHKYTRERAEKTMGESPGFFIGGNTLYGVSVSDCILRSMSIAEKIYK
jgi:oxygen-dependent protoporphyrinogen oxidase